METIEIVIYTMLAIILGGLIIAFLSGWDAGSTYEGLRTIVTGNHLSTYEKITTEDLPRAALELWEECGQGSMPVNKTLYITDDAMITKADLFDLYKQFKICHTIQSVENGCGTDENVIMGDLQGPAIVSMKCREDKTLYISQEPEHEAADTCVPEEEVCGDGIDQDCDGSDQECDECSNCQGS